MVTMGMDFGSSESAAAVKENGIPCILTVNTVGEETQLTAMLRFIASDGKEVVVLSNSIHESEVLRNLTCEELAVAKGKGDFKKFSIDHLRFHAEMISDDMASKGNLTLYYPEQIDDDVRESLGSFWQEILDELKNSELPANRWAKRFAGVKLLPAEMSSIYTMFKESPAAWNDSYDGNCSYQTLTELFMGAFFHSVLQVNPELMDSIMQEKSLRLVLGCPAAVEWLDKKSEYADLVRRAILKGRFKDLKRNGRF